jgi:hypothetical protein
VFFDQDRTSDRAMDLGGLMNRGQGLFEDRQRDEQLSGASADGRIPTGSS